jgi:transglutaminase-like putative cysteine protease
VTATATPPRDRRSNGQPSAGGPRRPPSPPPPAPSWVRLAPRWLTLAALGTYGALRWSTLVRPQATAAMVGLLAVALVATGAVHALGRLRRALQAPAAVIVAFAWLALTALISGAPAAMVDAPRQWDDLATGIQQGIGQLPRLLMPYQAADQWPRITILVGGALLLTSGALLAMLPRRGGDGQRMIAAIPLLALTIVPATIMQQSAPVLGGVVLFVLLAAFLWLERLPRVDLPIVVGLVALAGVAGVLVAPALDRGKPWIDAQSLVDGIDHPDPSQFDWSQHYGPLDSPRDGREVLRVRSRHPYYWKTQNLDGFDGLHWVAADAPGYVVRADQQVPDQALTDPSWRSTITVTLRQMTSSDLIGAGTTLGIVAPPEGTRPGGSPGTYTTDKPLGPGDSYTASVLVARPTRGQMTRAGTSYPREIERYRDIDLPRQDATGAWTTGGDAVHFSPFDNNIPSTQDGIAEALASTPYARAYALARSLGAGSSTPYAYVRQVLRYLQRDYRYSETPPQRPVPLEAFLFRDRVGYCQQFAGAAALLLRMGGVPTRVAAGFTSGTRDQNDEYVVRDYDAHAWIEVWFPHYGWVTFDPTPPTAPALTGQDARAVTAGSLPNTPSLRFPVRHRDTAAPTPPTPLPSTGVGGGFPWAWVVAGAVALTLATGLLVRRRRRRPARGADRLLAELERALRRTGRAPAQGVTLRQLEQRFHDAPEAAAYVRTLRLARYAGGDPHVTLRQRRALRTELGQGLGLVGRLRALLALPPRPR